MKQTKPSKSKKKRFSSFDLASAYKQLGIKTLTHWELPDLAMAPSEFFIKRLERLHRNFDLRSYEESKKLLIDAFCEEAMDSIDKLKIWKGGKIESDILIGNADYLIAARQDYLDTPFLCIVEAKRDDFEQGLAQCLVEMQACQWENRQVGKEIDVLGIVTNGQGWIFYKLTLTDKVYETGMYSSDDVAKTLGALRLAFQECENNL
ncbi:MAG: hypothetical protein ACK5EU_08310 [Pseudanabaena sp.]|jgi:hypothetical protein|nr:hypothetical protein [Pseudanabaena sp. M051S1SP1A06QC]MCA6590231.1 hypothetical protein [Pseudanabaena sp. M109S1SP1A06QC]MCA6606638.1 hypothetical protein [Pseudanabaena sp. M007S1SP1A06QC]MCE2977970.1 hypothetical protein [Pseudanabaena sp. CoA8_M7]